MNRSQLKTILNDLEKKMVFVVGPRQVGKTWLSKRIMEHYENSLYLNYDSYDDRRIINDQCFDLIVDGKNIRQQQCDIIALIVCRRRDQRARVLKPAWHVIYSSLRQIQPRPPGWHLAILGQQGAPQAPPFLPQPASPKHGSFPQYLLNFGPIQSSARALGRK